MLHEKIMCVQYIYIYIKEINRRLNILFTKKNMQWKDTQEYKDIR